MAQDVLDLQNEMRAVEKERDAKKDEIEKMKQDFNLQSVQLEKLAKDLEKTKKSGDLEGEIAKLKMEITRLDADSKTKQQIITQLEKDVMNARGQVTELEVRLNAAKADDGSASKITDLEATVAALKSKAGEADVLRSELEKLKSQPSDDLGLCRSDLDKEKAEFEAEKKRLFKEMEDFEVGLRMEMDEKDQKLQDLEARVASIKASPAPAAALETEHRPTKEDLIAKLGLDKVDVGIARAGLAPGPVSDVTYAPTEGDRVVCPKCGNTNVKVESDRSRVLTYIGGIPFYGKKFSCKRCMFDFRTD